MTSSPGEQVVVVERSVVTGARGHGPLRLLTPRNHAWVCASSPGAGFVGPDELLLDVEVRAVHDRREGIHE